MKIQKVWYFTRYSCCFIYCLLAINLAVAVKFNDKTDSVLGSQIEGEVAAFGDYNADRIVDIFTLKVKNEGENDQDQEISVFLGKDMKQYEHKNLISRDKGDRIVSVIPGDYDGDGRMDVIVCRKKDDSINMQVYWQNANASALSGPHNIWPGRFKDQPLIFNYNNDMIPDILVELDNSSRVVYIASNTSRGFKANSSFPHYGASPSPFKTPNSHAFVDWNNDYSADVLLTTEDGIEVCFKRGDKDFECSKRISYPNVTNGKIHQMAISDINENGHINLLLPVCTDDNCHQSSLYIYTNTSTDPHNKWIQVTNDKSFIMDGHQYGFVPPDQKNHNYPITVRPGSFNMDGYMDLAVTMRKTDESDAQPTAMILENVACSDSTCQAIGRTFRAVEQSALQNTGNVRLATFFDTYDDGILDMLVVSTEAGEPVITLYMQTSTHDAYFMRVTVLSGACHKDCPLYGANPPGPMVRYDTTGAEGHKQRSIAGQLPQCSYFALNAPYTLFGLGQTSNFIDNVKVGIPSAPPMTNVWEQIIPNSKLYVIPPLPGKNTQWVLKLFVTPSQRVLLTGAVLLGFMFVVAILVGVLHWREKREDAEEKRQDAHNFHFDAM